MKKCPACAEEILDEAIKCKHCGERFGESQPPAVAATVTTPAGIEKCLWCHKDIDPSTLTSDPDKCPHCKRSRKAGAKLLPVLMLVLVGIFWYVFSVLGGGSISTTSPQASAARGEGLVDGRSAIDKYALSGGDFSMSESEISPIMDRIMTKQEPEMRQKLGAQYDAWRDGFRDGVRDRYSEIRDEKLKKL